MLRLWRYVWFRSAAYYLACGAAKLRHCLSSGWLLHPAGLALVAGALAGLWTVKSGWNTVAQGVLSWTFAAEVLVVYALLLQIVQGYRNRGRLTVLATVNYAGKDFDSFATGLPAELANELGRLSKLYETIDEANPPASDKSVSGLKVKVDARGEPLANVVGESAVKLGGFLDVKLRPLVAAVERLIPRRVLSTSLHRTGNRLTLLAEMPGVEANWRVERPLAVAACAEGTAAMLSEMMEEFIYRVAAEMVPTGSEEWEAVKRFSEGLRAYRRTRTTDMNKNINLREAEEHFFAAYSLDKCFWRCSYNLGVVYRERRDEKAAMAAFEQTIKDNPIHAADAAYALSVIHRDAEEWKRALEFAEQAITHAPRDMPAWNMKGFLWRRVQAEPESEAAWRSSLTFREKAAALAWRDLCRAAWRGRPLDAPRKAVVIPFANLAGAHLTLNNFRRGARILRQAIGQQPDASLYFELGKGLQKTGAKSRTKLSKALEAFRSAVHFAQTDTKRALYHAFIAETAATIAALLTKCYIRRPALRAYEQAYQAALASPSSIDKDTQKALTRACNAVKEVHRCSVIECIGNVNDALERVKDENLDLFTRIEQAEKLARFLSGHAEVSEHPEVTKIITWGQAVCNIEIVSLRMSVKLGPDAYEDSKKRLSESISRLEEHFPVEERLGEANERVAEALRLQSKFVDALPFAEKAVALSPFSSGAIRQLGLVHFNLANYDQAEKELRRSFALDPSDALTLRFIGEIAWSRGAPLTNREERRSEFKKVVETFSQAADLAKTDRDRGELYFNLGQFHSDLKEYDLAAKHYEMALALNTYPFECRYRLGFDGVVEQELYDQAESHLRDAFSEIFKLRRAARDQDKRSGITPNSPTDWWRTPRELSERVFSEDKRPPGYFLLNICLLMALVFAERGCDIERAKRWLGFVNRHMHFLGEPARGEGRDERARYEERREIRARYEDYLGWVYRLEGDAKKTLTHITESVKIVEDAVSLCHLARVYLDQAATDKTAVVRALEFCDRAKKADIRGVFAKRIEKIEADAKSLRGAADAETTNEKKDVANAGEGAGQAMSGAP